MERTESSRRRFLRAAATGTVVGLVGGAGCLGSGAPGETTNGGGGGASMPEGPWSGNSPQFQYDAAHSGGGTAPGPTGDVSKHATFPKDADGVEQVRTPAVVDGVAYVTYGGETGGTPFTDLAAYNVETADRLWRRRAEGRSVDSTPTMPAVSGGTVFFGTGEKLYAYDARSGDQQWAAEHSFESTTRPTVANDRVLVEDNTNLYAVGASSGELVWTFEPRTIEYTVFVRPPAVADGTVFVCASHLEAVRASDGTKLWDVEFPARSMSAPTVGENAVYVGTKQGKVYAYPLDGGDPLWQKSVSDSLDGISESMAVSEETLVARNGQFEGVTALDAADGTELWRNQVRSAGPPIITNDRVYVRDISKVVSYDRESGERLWKYKQPVPEGQSEPPVVSGKYAFFVLGKDRLVCLSGSE